MKEKKNIVIAAIGFLVGIIGYWTIDFSDDRALFNTVFRIMGPGAFLGAIISSFYRKKSPFSNSLMISLGVILGMLSRILWDIFQDPSSYNRFPFELMISLAIVLPAAFLGVFLIYSIFWIAGEKATKDNS